MRGGMVVGVTAVMVVVSVPLSTSGDGGFGGSGSGGGSDPGMDQFWDPETNELPPFLQRDKLVENGYAIDPFKMGIFDGKLLKSCYYFDPLSA